MPLQNKKFHFHHLKKKWTARHQKLQHKLWSKHKEALEWAKSNTKQLAVGSLGGIMFLTSPMTVSTPPAHSLLANQEQVGQKINSLSSLILELASVLPKTVQPLTTEEEQKITAILSKKFDFKVAAELNDKRLNRSYGLIGAEQHLYRYPGDTLERHAENAEEWRLYGRSGIAPGLGAWGYFARSENEFTNKEKLREKYYIAVQTFLCPGFYENVKECTDFFKYRKMLIVNPNNGKAVVAVIGDAGPAEWTGKHLGGSPEVMHYLERYDGSQRGPVLYFFIDDPEDKVPLGPIKL